MKNLSSLHLINECNTYAQMSSFHSSPVARMASGGRQFQTEGLVSFKLTDIGEGIAECEILKWFVKPGDKINEFDPICEVQSDKATVAISSRYTGTITKLHYEKGDLAKVGTPLIDIDLGGAAKPAAASPASPASKEVAAPQHTGVIRAPDQSSTSHSYPHPHGGVAHEGKPLTVPSVRRLAKENRIDLTQVKGTGKQGRILKEDVLNFIENKGQASKEAQAPSPTPTPIPAQSATPQPSATRAPRQDRTEPIRGLARTMVKTMTASALIPQLGYSDEIRMDALHLLREQMKVTAEKKGIKLSYLPIIIKAMSLALKDYPVLNSSVNKDVTEIIYKASHNIGIAMDTAQGLLVPNIKDCENKTIFDIAAELGRLQKLGASGQLGANELTNGTISISNIGSIGGTYASPVLLPPEVAIVALGKMQVLPRFDEKGNVIASRVMNASWSADHRIVDGASIANFCNLWKKYLENPSTMISAMI